MDHLLTVADLVAASESALVDDPELSLLLATQAVRETVDLGFARLIVLGQSESIMWPLGLSEEGVNWLDEQLGATDQDCLAARINHDISPN